LLRRIRDRLRDNGRERPRLRRGRAGLSMDYETFLMSRIKELHDTGSANAHAVTHGLARAGSDVPI